MAIQELKNFFKTVEIPSGYKLYPGTIISDPQLFLESQFLVIESFKGDLDNCSAWWRLNDLYEQLKGNS